MFKITYVTFKGCYNEVADTERDAILRVRETLSTAEDTVCAVIFDETGRFLSSTAK